MYLDVSAARLELLHFLTTEIVHFLGEVQVQHVSDVVFQQPSQRLKIAGIHTFNILVQSSNSESMRMDLLVPYSNVRAGNGYVKLAGEYLRM